MSLVLFVFLGSGYLWVWEEVLWTWPVSLLCKNSLGSSCLWVWKVWGRWLGQGWALWVRLERKYVCVSQGRRFSVLWAHVVSGRRGIGARLWDSPVIQSVSEPWESICLLVWVGLCGIEHYICSLTEIKSVFWFIYLDFFLSHFVFVFHDVIILILSFTHISITLYIGT